MRRISRLQKRIFFGTMAVIVFILAALLISLNAVLLYNEKRETQLFLQELVKNGGHYPTDGERNPSAWFKKHLFSARNNAPAFTISFNMPDFIYFSVELSDSDDITGIVTDYPLMYTDADLADVVSQILAEKREVGRKNGMVYRICHTEKGRLLCVANLQNEVALVSRLRMYSAEVFVASFFAALVFSVILSALIARPAVNAYIKQREFISDAGHELKTPIAVIGANVDVLRSEFPENKWLGYIKTENERMGQLVKDLLFLARTDAHQRLPNMMSFDFSSVVENSVLPFESVIFEQQKHLQMNIEKGMSCHGDEHQIKQVVMILVDNAIKNSEKDAIIRISAYNGGKNCVVKVYNTGHGIQANELEKIFERFYRSDTSRARQTGGYGLGLPIARTIVHAHHGTLTVESAFGEWAEFTLRLPK